MTDKPKIELVDAKWRFEDDFWFVVERSGNTRDDETILSSDGESMVVTEGGVGMSMQAHNVLAVLDHSGALDEYLKRREEAKQERIRRENEEAMAHIPKTCLCNGAGRVWRHELSDSSWDGEADDTRYDCPECRAREEGEP